MLSKAKKLKQIVKKTDEDFGTDPRDPWSPKYSVAESSALNQYLLSRGFNPQHTSKDIKIAHSKSNQFKLWQRQRMAESSPEETPTGTKHKTQSDAEISYTKKNMRKHRPSYEIHNPPGTLRREEVIDEISLGDYQKKAKEQSKELEKHTKGEYGGIAQRMLDRRKKGLAMAAKREEVEIEEAKKPKLSASEKLQRAIERQRQKDKDARTGSSGFDYDEHQRKLDALMKSMNKEDVGDPQAAIKGVGIPVPEQKESMAKKIKAMYKKNVKEDTYDAEKDDKYSENPTFGKKPVMKDLTGKSSNIGNEQSDAAVILTGGTTMTGKKRDTVEIDPKLRNPRPSEYDPLGTKNKKQ